MRAGSPTSRWPKGSAFRRHRACGACGHSRSGYIHGYHAELDPDLIGYEVTAFCHVGLISQAESDLRAFEALVRSWANVRECHMLMGEDDFILKVMAPSVDELNAFIISHLTSAPNVKNVKTAICIRRSDRKPSVPVPTA